MGPSTTPNLQAPRQNPRGLMHCQPCCKQCSRVGSVNSARGQLTYHWFPVQCWSLRLDLRIVVVAQSRHRSRCQDRGCLQYHLRRRINITYNLAAVSHLVSLGISRSRSQITLVLCPCLRLFVRILRDAVSSVAPRRHRVLSQRFRVSHRHLVCHTAQ